MTQLSQAVDDLTTSTDALLAEVTGQKATLQTKVDQASADAAATAADRSAVATDKAIVAADRGAAETARTGAETAEANAVAVVTGGTASLTPAPGMIPLADANGEIAYWLQKGLLGNVQSPLVDLPLNQIETIPFAAATTSAVAPAATDVTNWVGLLRTMTLSFVAIPEGVQSGQYAMIGGAEYPIVAVDTVNNTITIEYDLSHADPTGTPLVTFAMWRFSGSYRGLTSFSRVSRKAYIDPLTGLLRGCPAGFPAFERMADGGTGVLLEGSSTNYATGTLPGTTGVTGAAPTGVNDNLRQWNVAGGAAGYINLLTSNTFLAGPLTLGIWLKSADGTSYQVIMAGHDGAAWTPQVTVTVTNQWQFFTYTITAQNSSAYVLLEGSTAYGLPAPVNILLWRWNIEALPFSTSLMPYNSTRAADYFSIPASGNLCSMVDDMTYVIDFDALGNIGHSNRQGLFYVASEGYRIIFINRAYDGRVKFYSGPEGASTIDGTSLPPVGTSVHCVAARVSNGVMSLALDGVFESITRPAAVTGGAALEIHIGRFINEFMYGHVRNVRIYDRALTDAEIVATA